MNLIFTHRARTIKLAKITSLVYATLMFAINVFAAPVISSFSPASGPVGTSVILTGSGFSATPTQNVVFFGATKATVIAASASSLTVIVPGGSTYENITVTNRDVAQTDYSAKPFIVTLNGGRVFKPKMDFTTGTGPSYNRHADFDGDGYADIVVVNRIGNSISVLQNFSVPGSPFFGANLDFATPDVPTGLAIGDLDGDGKPDVVVACFGGQSISVFRNTSTIGTISFASRVDIATGLNYEATIADFDGDGKPDVAMPNRNNNTVMILRNTSPAAGSVSFAPKITFPCGTIPVSVTSGDIDGDGKADLVTANSSNTVSILRNTSTVGTISFAPKTDAITDPDPRSCIIGDLDGDGKAEVVTANYGGTTISIFHNTSTVGAVSFGTQQILIVPDHPQAIGMGDINGDGKPDLAVAVPGMGLITYMNLSGAGTITFSKDQLTAAGTGAGCVTIGDLDGDARPDLSLANYNVGTISVIQQARLPHSITGISPMSGPVGSSVIISGTNFSTTAAQNIVFFGATKATVTAATATSLTVTVPLGSTYQFISVTNLSTHLTSFSDKIFNVTLAGNTSFNPRQDLAVSSNPASVAVGDLDGDGKPDLAMVNSSATPVTVIRNTSTSGLVSFATKQDFGSGTDVQSVTIGDLDGDGKPDLAVACFGTQTIDVYRNTSVPGTISFASPVAFATAYPPLNAAMDDIDGDGKPDLAIACTSDKVIILRNLSTPGIISFDTVITFPILNNSQAVSLGDIDGDGKPDLAVSNGASGSMSLLRNISFPGLILFAAKIDFTTSPNPGKLVIADIDGDGKSDISVAVKDNNMISVFRNTSTPGTFSLAAKVDVTTPASPRSFGIGDVDGDGRPDLATSNYNATSASLLKNTSTPGIISFAPRIDLIAPTNPESIAICDIDGDGKPDMSVVSFSGTLSVYKQIVVVIPPTITGVSPSSGAVGSSVVISGTNFNTTVAQNIVYFGATKATVTAATASNLTVTVPLGSTYQFISATNLSTNLTAFSDKIFNVTFPGSTSFKSKQDLAVGPDPNSVTIGDLDGDGKPDLAMTNSSVSPISVIRNTSAGGVVSFAPRQDFGSGTQATFVVIADVDGDGKPDLFVGFWGSTMQIYRNTSVPGTISFAPPVGIANGVSPYSQNGAIDDIDGDGKPDLAVARGINKVMILRNLSTPGTIAFDTPLEFSTATNSFDVSLGDMDGDGKPDLVVSNDVSGSISLLRNISVSGSIQFAAKVDFVTGPNPGGVSLADIDGDGKLDIAVAGRGNNVFTVFRNTSTTGSISLAPKVDVATPTFPSSLSVGDIDGDGKPDLATANLYATSASLLKNTSSPGNISFATRIDLAAAFNPISVAIGDIDGDGSPDISVVALSDVLSVFQQIVAVPPPTGNAAQSFCASVSPKVSDLVATGTAIKWYSAGNVLLAATTQLVHATTYYASQTVNGIESEQRLGVTVTINAVGTNVTWLGLTNNWHSPANWSSGAVPNTCMNVIVNNGAGIVMPVVTGINGVCNKLTLNSGATITIATGAKLLIAQRN
ncbi:MAG: FG-GAP-like repeat-containing protein [Chitinophagaceae bacterium]